MEVSAGSVPDIKSADAVVLSIVSRLAAGFSRQLLHLFNAKIESNTFASVTGSFMLGFMK